MGRRLRILGTLALLAAGQAIAQPTPPALVDLAFEQAAAEVAYLAFFDAPVAPSPRLIAVRAEIIEMQRALGYNYALRQAYESGREAVAGSTPEERAARLSAILGGLSNTISSQHATLSRLESERDALERLEFEEPMDRAWARWTAATDARDAALKRAEAAGGPFTVTGVAIHEEADLAQLFSGRWVATGGADAEREHAVVVGLEATLAAVRADIARLRPQNLALAEGVAAAGWAWNAAYQELVSRGEFDALRDIVVQAVADAFDVAISIGTAGTWTTLRVAYAVGENVLRLRSAYLASNASAANVGTIEASLISDATKAAITERISGDIAGGRLLDPEELLDRAHGLPTTPRPEVAGPATYVVLDALSRNDLSNGISAMIAYFEQEGRERILRGDIPADGLLANALLTSARPTGNTGFWWDAVPHVAAQQKWFDAIWDEARGTIVSVGLSWAAGGFEIANDFFRAIGGMSDEELIGELAMAELEVFILSEAYRQSRARYDAHTLAEPILVEQLAAARHRLARVSANVFVDAAGDPVDRRAISAGPHRGPLLVSVEASGVRAPWRVDVVDTGGSAERIVGTTTVSANAGIAVVAVDTEALPLPAAVGPPAARLEIRVHAADVAAQEVDGDPATRASIDPRSLAWTGLEAGPDIYRFALFAAACPTAATGAPPGMVASNFSVDAEGWTVDGDAGPEPTFAPGELSATDRGENDVWYWVAPPQFLGNRSDLFGTELRYTLRITPLTNSFGAPDIVLEGGGLTMTLDANVPATTWATYAHRLDSSAPWMLGNEQATDADIRRVLDCLTALRIRGEYETGEDTGWLGPVEFGAGPPAVEAATIDWWRRLDTRDFGRRFTYVCAARGPDGGAGVVWGTDVYTDDSAICPAAAHFGIITNKGGVVHIESVAGLDGYEGTERNGIATRGWGPWGGSIRFVVQ